VGGIEPNGTVLKDVWQYNSIADTWKKMNDFPGPARWSMAAFSIFNKGYLGTGTNGAGYFQDFWKYNPQNDEWIQIADFGGEGRRETAFFVVGEKAFVGLGYSSISGAPKKVYSDFYGYQLITDSWTPIDAFPPGPTYYAEAIGGSTSGMVIGGFDTANQFSEKVYLLDENQLWVKVNDFPLGSIRGSSTFLIKNQFYSVSGLKGDYSRSNALVRYTLGNLEVELFVYPNPTDGRLIVKGNPNVYLRVLNVVGQDIEVFQLSELGVAEIEIKGKGMYWISESEKPSKSIAFIVR
jgi:N-acetylneuraminic acid mutarotase